MIMEAVNGFGRASCAHCALPGLPASHHHGRLWLYNVQGQSLMKTSGSVHSCRHWLVGEVHLEACFWKGVGGSLRVEKEMRGQFGKHTSRKRVNKMTFTAQEFWNYFCVRTGQIKDLHPEEPGNCNGFSCSLSHCGRGCCPLAHGNLVSTFTGSVTLGKLFSTL